ncbi:hypothetical protein HWQ46_20265 [Shewanella sp. D64]|uniref:hypothetical protein n=1 Tax=unclassified Shewanella TaxID=196818 RepID=UPI0022BA578E|nr:MULTISPECIES: hypothetical protein [unclassified Shewanella]MEC4727873.1 hypothetical protein [Shewanella sp. D64]MEC4739915.1 hypothetical protein [Shewanella sp. E94]WBJ97120.1 hypothetical protein HWQ47_08445 [Shewanella sp. MTB7]
MQGNAIEQQISADGSYLLRVMHLGMCAPIGLLITAMVVIDTVDSALPNIGRLTVLIAGTVIAAKTNLFW